MPREPTTLMSAAGLRGSKSFAGRPLIFEGWRQPPFSWPRPGEHLRLVKVVDWKALQGVDDSEFLRSACLCLRCACHRNYLKTGDCQSRTEAQDQLLLRRAAAHFNSWAKVKGVLFEATMLFQEKELDYSRMLRE